MSVSEPLSPTMHFPLQFFIKNYYKCASRSLSRLQGSFLEKCTLKKHYKCAPRKPSRLRSIPHQRFLKWGKRISKSALAEGPAL